MSRFLFRFLPRLCLVLALAGCAASLETVAFAVRRPPMLGLMEGRRVAILGFNGEDIGLAGRIDALVTRRLHADTTVTFITPIEVLRVLSRHAYIPGQIPDTLALAVGGMVAADVVLIGWVGHVYTEQYGEEKKYRMAETFRPGGTGSMQIRLDSVPYYEPYIDQVATLRGTLRMLDVATGQEKSRESVSYTDTLRVVLPTPVEKPPKGPVAVERITPGLEDKTVLGLIDRLVQTFVWHDVRLNRYVYRNVPGGAAGLSALSSGDWPRARMIWEQSVQEEPDNPAVWNNLAVAYEATGQTAEARKAYEKALALNPGATAILHNSRGE
jgi:hypothetical protein